MTFVFSLLNNLNSELVSLPQKKIYQHLECFLRLIICGVLIFSLLYSQRLMSSFSDFFIFFWTIQELGSNEEGDVGLPWSMSITGPLFRLMLFVLPFEDPVKQISTFLWKPKCSYNWLSWILFRYQKNYSTWQIIHDDSRKVLLWEVPIQHSPEFDAFQ